MSDHRRWEMSDEVKFLQGLGGHSDIQAHEPPLVLDEDESTRIRRKRLLRAYIRSMGEGGVRVEMGELDRPKLRLLAMEMLAACSRSVSPWVAWPTTTSPSTVGTRR